MRFVLQEIGVVWSLHGRFSELFSFVEGVIVDIFSLCGVHWVSDAVGLGCSAQGASSGPVDVGGGDTFFWDPVSDMEPGFAESAGMCAGYVFGSQTLVVCDVVALSLGVTAVYLTLAHVLATFVLHLLARVQRTRASRVSDRFVPAVDVLDRQVFLGA